MSTPDSAVLDHFTIDNSFLYLPGHPKAYTVAAFDKLRKASGYRPHYYTVPGPDQQPIPAGYSLIYEVKMIAGTIIWGLTFWDAAQLPEAFNIKEKNGRQMFSEPVDCGVWIANSASTGIWYLDEPFTVGDPPLIQAEIYNGSSTTSGFNTQLVILTAQPQSRKDTVLP